MYTYIERERNTHTYVCLFYVSLELLGLGHAGHGSAADEDAARVDGDGIVLLEVVDDRPREHQDARRRALDDDLTVCVIIVIIVIMLIMIIIVIISSSSSSRSSSSSMATSLSVIPVLSLLARLTSRRCWGPAVLQSAGQLTWKIIISIIINNTLVLIYDYY